MQSASPITATYTNTTDDNVNQYLSNADLVSGQPAILNEHVGSSGKLIPGGKLLNWAAFTSPPVDSNGDQLRNGDSPTNGYRLFGLREWDLAASRSWELWRGLNLNFRVDAFNLLNTANFANVLSTWATTNPTTFGQSLATYASAFGGTASGFGTAGSQLNVFQNGGPRELQLMKLKF